MAIYDSTIAMISYLHPYVKGKRNEQNQYDRMTKLLFSLGFQHWDIEISMNKRKDKDNKSDESNSLYNVGHPVPPETQPTPDIVRRAQNKLIYHISSIGNVKFLY